MANTNPLIQLVENPKVAVILLGKTPKDYLVTLTNVASNVLRTYNIYKGWNQSVKSSIEKNSLFSNIILVSDNETKDCENLARRFGARLYSYSEFTYRVKYLSEAYDVLNYIKSEVYGGDLELDPRFPINTLYAYNSTDKYSIEVPSFPKANINVGLSLENGKYEYSVPFIKEYIPVSNAEIVDSMGRGFDEVSLCQ